jgi:hypothetical protein
MTPIFAIFSINLSLTSHLEPNLDEGVFNRVFIISPTYESNPQFEALRADPGDIYESFEGAVDDLKDILSKVEQDWLLVELPEKSMISNIQLKYIKKPFVLFADQYDSY